MVDQPSEDDTIKILRGLQNKYEEHHRIKISEDAIQAAVRLSSRYISGKFQPDKAIDVLDEAGSRLTCRHLHAQGIYRHGDRRSPIC